MTEHNRTFDQQQHVESHAPYLTVFFILLNYTAMEYVYARFFLARHLPLTLVGIAVGITLVTAVAARMYHLRFNRNWVYLAVVPAVLLSILPVPLLLGLLILAITKALLVGIWFMHLKFEGRWVYYMLIPAGVLAVIFTIALYPDIAMQPSEREQTVQGEDLSLARPAPNPGTSFS